MTRYLRVATLGDANAPGPNDTLSFAGMSYQE
jgi:hypothetical protein